MGSFVPKNKNEQTAWFHLSKKYAKNILKTFSPNSVNIDMPGKGHISFGL